MRNSILHNKYLLIHVTHFLQNTHSCIFILSRPSLIIIPIHREQSRTIIIVPEVKDQLLCLSNDTQPFFYHFVFRALHSSPYFLFLSPRLILSSPLNRARKSREISLARSRTARSRLNPKTTRTSFDVRPRPPVRRRCVRPMASPHSGESYLRENAPLSRNRAPRRTASPDSQGGGDSPVLWDHDGPHSRRAFIANYDQVVSNL